MGRKVYLDDLRPAPAGWTRVFWPNEAISLLKLGDVSDLSLDHDLGDDDRGTGNDVLLWVEQQVATSGFIPPRTINVHSANSSAEQKMKSGIASVYRFYGQQLLGRPGWSDEAPVAMGGYYVSCHETDYRPAAVRVYRDEGGGAVVMDPELGVEVSLERYHAGFPGIRWLRDPAKFAND